MNKRHYEHTLPNIRGSLSNTYDTEWGEMWCMQEKSEKFFIGIYIFVYQ